MKAREVDLTQSLVAQLEVNTVRSDGELEGHGLVGFCHCGYCSVVSMTGGKKAKYLALPSICSITGNNDYVIMANSNAL